MQNAGFPEPVLVANACFADSTVWKGHCQEKTAFLHTLFVENEREVTSELKWGGGGGGYVFL